MPDDQIPNGDLLDVLRPSLAPCADLCGRCAGQVRYEPESGHVPRGWIGGNGPSEGIRLVLVTAEPGDPATGEAYPLDDPEATLRAYSRFARASLAVGELRRDGKPAPFHKNLGNILDLFWPGADLAEQLSKTWITPAVLCSAAVSGGTVLRIVEDACAERYLRHELAALPNAFVVALGGKADARLRRMGRAPDAVAQHPSARPNTNPSASWTAAAERFRASG